MGMHSARQRSKVPPVNGDGVVRCEQTLMWQETYQLILNTAVLNICCTGFSNLITLDINFHVQIEELFLPRLWVKQDR